MASPIDPWAFAPNRSPSSEAVALAKIACRRLAKIRGEWSCFVCINLMHDGKIGRLPEGAAVEHPWRSEVCGRHEAHPNCHQWSNGDAGVEDVLLGRDHTALVLR